MFRRWHIFLRNKKPLWVKVQAVTDYALGLSYRKIKNKLRFLYGLGVALSAIWRWVKAFQERARLNIGAKEHSQVAVDETVVKVCGHRCFVWAAIDIHTKELVAFDYSAGRSELDAKVFLAKVKARCAGELPIVLTDRGPWYNIVGSMGFTHWHNTFSLRNPIERFFGLVKDRTRVFYNNVNCGSPKRLLMFMRVFAWYYMNIRRVVS